MDTDSATQTQFKLMEFFSFFPIGILKKVLLQSSHVWAKISNLIVKHWFAALGCTFSFIQIYVFATYQ